LTRGLARGLEIAPCLAEASRQRLQPEALWRGISHTNLAVVPGCAHNVHLEKPLIFNAIVEDFLHGNS